MRSLPALALLLAALAAASRAGAQSGGPVTIAVDPSADRRPVSPLVYGVSFGAPGSDLRYPLRRWGGNSVTRYSWNDDVSNRASDWFFMNIENPDPGTLPDGSSSDVFIDTSRAAGGEVLLTVPTIGWTPIDRVRRWGFSVAKYGPQQDTECTVTGNPPWCNPDAGNGIDPAGNPITGNDPLDTSRPVDPTFVTGWMDHVSSRVGRAGAGGVRLFALDNEPMLWSSTHRDVHPQKLGDDEIWQRTLDYSSAIKARDPDALVLGPVSWGWCDYFWTDLDGCGNDAGLDHARNGPFLEWYLAQVRAHETATGTRLVDVLDIHYYPQANGVALSDDESPAVQDRRLRSVRSLWDPAYADESWVGANVQLVPRMRDIIARNAPGTQLAITEYNWGNDGGISSALAQAEVLGVFGREGVDYAARWVAPAPGSPVEDAFRVYLDWNGAGERIGGDSVRASSTDAARVEAYAIRAPDDRVFVVIVNETRSAQDADVTVSGAIDGAVPLRGFEEGAGYGARGSVTSAAGAFTVSLPPLSLRLAVAQLACARPGVASDLHVRKGGAGLTFTWVDAPGAVDHVLHEDAVASGAFAATAGAGSSPLSIAMPPGNVYCLASGRNACGEGALR